MDESEHAPNTGSNDLDCDNCTDIQDYKHWRGNNRFFCNGVIMTGPKLGAEVVATLAAHGIVMLGLVSNSLTFVPYAFSKYNGSWLFTLSAFVGYLIGFWLYYCLLRAQFRDPGVLFRDFSYEDEAAGFPSDEKVLAQEQQKSRVDPVRAGAHIYKVRYCHTCHIMKPPKASHCGVCDNCVAEFDHHCTFINNCIGRRNMAAFCMFLFLCIVWAVWYCGMGAYYFLHALYYTCDLYRLYVTIPVTLVAIPFIIPLFDLYEISQCKIIAGSIAFLSLIITFCYRVIK